MPIRSLISVLALSLASLGAQEVHFGIQVGGSSPQSDLKNNMDSKIGYTAGLNLALEFRGGHVLRPRVDYTLHKVSRIEPTFGFTYDFKNTTLFVGADYNYFVSGKADHGFYLLAGLGYASTKIGAYGLKISASDPGTTITESKGAIAYAVGLGFQLTSLLGVETRYNATHPELDGYSYKNESVNATITLRF